MPAAPCFGKDQMDFKHISVLLQETIEGLDIKPEGIYADGTLGGGGHSLEIVKQLTSGRLICMDRDGEAIEAAKERLSGHEGKISFVRSNFDRFGQVLDELGISGVDGIVLDLGVSSYQLDTPERGFSYNHDAPLDMRMDARCERTAADIVNGASEEELIRILRVYGEERFAGRIAGIIVKEREKGKIQTTFELNEIVRRAIPNKFRRDGGHPSKRTFQAVRIAVNGELDSLESALGVMIERLNFGGRLCVITFHSLEDRIVKNAFKTARDPCTCPPDFPVCVCGKKSLGRVVTNKPVLPSEEEMVKNPRSKSAKLRIFERQ